MARPTSRTRSVWRLDRLPHAQLPLHLALDHDDALVWVGFGAREPSSLGGLAAHAARHGATIKLETRKSTGARRELAEYLAGTRKRFGVRLSPFGTPFQLRAWEALVAIPYGRTASYAEQAASIGSPKATRAVGLANGANPLPIVVPCHRVVGAQGDLGGFGGGLAVKRWLLELERRGPPAWHPTSRTDLQLAMF